MQGWVPSHSRGASCPPFFLNQTTSGQDFSGGGESWNSDDIWCILCSRGCSKDAFFVSKEGRTNCLTHRAASWQKMHAGSGMSSLLLDMFSWHLPKMLWKGSLPLVTDWTTRPVKAFASTKTPWNRLYGSLRNHWMHKGGEDVLKTFQIAIGSIHFLKPTLV